MDLYTHSCTLVCSQIHTGFELTLIPKPESNTHTQSKNTFPRLQSEQRHREFTKGMQTWTRTCLPHTHTSSLYPTTGPDTRFYSHAQNGNAKDSRDTHSHARTAGHGRQPYRLVHTSVYVRGIHTQHSQLNWLMCWYVARSLHVALASSV